MNSKAMVKMELDDDTAGSGGGTVPKVYLPGDLIQLPSTAPKSREQSSVQKQQGVKSKMTKASNLVQSIGQQPTIIGPGSGLRRISDDRIVATNCGVLRNKDGNTFWLDTHSKRYIPVEEDRVIGIVTQRMGEGWKVDIGSSDIAQLGMLSFEGATKRNRAMFKEGTVLYCRVKVAIRDMEPEVTCVADDDKARGLGVLPCDSGFSCLFELPLNLCRKVLTAKFNLLEVLGKLVKFEITVGMNGRVWIKSNGPREVIGIANCINESMYISSAEIHPLAQKHYSWIKGFKSDV